MSYSYDGYLTFGTKIDTTDLEKSIAKMKQAAEQSANISGLLASTIV